jgi:hypothetical protein
MFFSTTDIIIIHCKELKVKLSLSLTHTHRQRQLHLFVMNIFFLILVCLTFNSYHLFSQTVTEDFACPFCLVQCGSFKVNY